MTFIKTRVINVIAPGLYFLKRNSINKLHLLKKAENLYCIENFTPDMIAEKLNISRRTVFNWKKKYKWGNSNRIKDFSKQFTGEIYSLGVKLLKKINEDLDNNRILNKHSICALEEIIKIITKREKEQTTTSISFNNNKKFNEGFTPDFINQIHKDILGWNGTY